MNLQRAWAMPNHNTFDIAPIRAWLAPYLQGVIIDPFARDQKLATITNDLNPATSAQYHMDVFAFVDWLLTFKEQADVILFDPPYSPRQLKECYESIGRAFTTQDGQVPGRWTKARDGLAQMLRPGGHALSFGWNSSGFGKKRGFELVRVLLVCHGSGHNDTICVAERKT